MTESYATQITNAPTKQRADELLEAATGIYNLSALTGDEWREACRAHAEYVQNRKPRVFILEESNKTTADAERYGKVVVLFPETAHRPSIWDDKICDATQRRFQTLGFDPDVDFVLLVGPQVLAVSAITYLARTYKQFRVLFWHAAAKEYVQRSFKGQNEA